MTVLKNGNYYIGDTRAYKLFHGGTEVWSHPGIDARYSLGGSTQSLLARSGAVPASGTFTLKWTDPSPVANTTYDFRDARFIGFFDADAIFGFGSFSNGSGGSNATPHQQNITPFDIGKSTPGQGIAVIGAYAEGDQDPTLTWNRMKHGSHIQAALDSGQTGDQAWALIVNNQNQDGDPRVHIDAGSYAVIDGMRCYNTHDGVGIFSTNDDSRTVDGTLYMRNSWIYKNHDDAIENDRQRALYVFDCLFEQCYTFLSTRPGDTTGSPVANHTQVIEESIIWLSAKPGPYQQPTSVQAHGDIYKNQTNSPGLQLKHCIIAAENFNSDIGGNLPERSGLDSYDSVTLVWLGSGPYPGNVPVGCELTTDRTVLDNAIAKWKQRHGVTDFATVDMDKLLNPDPLGVNGSSPGKVQPGTPLSVTAGGGNAQATVSWAAPTHSGGSAVTGYRITTTPGGVQTTVGAGTVSTTISGLTNNTAYTFAVAAQNAVGYGPESAPTAAVTPSLFPVTLAGVEALVQGHYPIVIDSNNNMYRLTMEYAAPTAGAGQPKMLKSADSGATWTEIDSTHRPASLPKAGWSFRNSSTIYHVGHSGTAVTFSTFAVSDAASNADTWRIAGESAVSGLSVAIDPLVSHVRNSDGTFWLFYSDSDSGANRQLAYVKRTAANTYSAKTQIGTTSNSYTSPIIVTGASNAHLFYKDHANGQLLWRTLSLTGTLSAATRIDTGGVNAAAIPLTNAIYYDSAGTEIVTILFADTTGMLKSITLSGGVAQPEQAVSTVAAMVNPGTTGNHSLVAHLAVNGTTLHAVWADASTGDLYYSIRSNGSTWAAPTLMWSSGDQEVEHVYSNIYTNNGVKRLGYTYDAGPHDGLTSGINYNEVLL